MRSAASARESGGRGPWLLPVLLLLVALLAPGCSGSDTARAEALLDRAVRAIGGRQILSRIHTLGIEFRGTVVTAPKYLSQSKLSGELFLRLPDGLATRVIVGGLLTRKSISGRGGWIRQGAAVRDLSPDEVLEEEAVRADWLAVLAAPLLSSRYELSLADDLDGDPAIRVTPKGEPSFLLAFDAKTGLPFRVKHSFERHDGQTEESTSTFSDWEDRGGLLFPDLMKTTAPGGWKQDLKITAVSVDPPPAAGAFTRPDDSGPGKAGKIRSSTFPATNAVMVAIQNRPFTELASVDLFLDGAIRLANGHRKGPLIRIFRKLPDGKGHSLIVTMAAVEYDRKGSSKDLPPNVRSEAIPETKLLAMPYTGPYPKSAAVFAPLYTRAKKLGLVPLGPPWDAVLSNPDEGAPNQLRQELRLPVGKPK